MAATDGKNALRPTSSSFEPQPTLPDAQPPQPYSAVSYCVGVHHSLDREDRVGMTVMTSVQGVIMFLMTFMVFIGKLTCFTLYKY